MKTSITIVNNTSYPVISVYCNEITIAEDILKNHSTKKIYTDTVCPVFDIKNNFNKSFHTVALKLQKNKNNKVIVKNHKTILI